MTPEQRAEKIANHMLKGWCECSDIKHTIFIAAEIQAAIDEAISNTLGPNVVHSQEWIDQEIDAAYKRGVSAGHLMAEDAIKKSEEKAEVCAREYHRICEGWEEALAEEREECAKLAEMSKNAAGMSNMGPSTACDVIAERIRARTHAAGGTGEEKK